MGVLSATDGPQHPAKTENTNRTATIRRRIKRFPSFVPLALIARRGVPKRQNGMHSRFAIINTNSNLQLRLDLGAGPCVMQHPERSQSGSTPGDMTRDTMVQHSTSLPMSAP